MNRLAELAREADGIATGLGCSGMPTVSPDTVERLANLVATALSEIAMRLPSVEVAARSRFLPPNARDRYDHDQGFRTLVDQTHSALASGETTPTELRDAVELAIALYERGIPPLPRKD